MNKIILNVFFITFILFQLYSCAERTEDSNLSDDNIAKTENITSNNEIEVQTLAPPDIEANDYDGYEFKMLGREVNGQDILFDEIFTESFNGEVINDAIYQRNKAIEEKYNVYIKSLIDQFNKYEKSVLASDNAYDAATPGVVTAFNYGMKNYSTEIKSIPYINYDKPWWNTYSITQTSINKKNYFIIGSINLLSYESTGVMFFNKKLITEYNFNNPYILVRDGKWTFDTMKQICAEIGSDLNGDSIYNEEDMYGLAINSYGALTFTYGANSNFAPKNTDDLPEYKMTENFITFFQNVVNTVTDYTSVLYGEKYGDKRITVMMEAFQEDRLLFFNEMLNRTSLLRSMETDFGILPMPKSDENQEGYSSFVHQGNSTTIVVPIIGQDIDRTGRVLEDMTYYSYIYVRPAYIETAIKGKYLRDEDSAEMVDIIIDSIKFDITLLSNSQLMADLRSMLTAGNTNVASAFAKNENKYVSKLEEVIKAFSE